MIYFVISYIIYLLSFNIVKMFTKKNIGLFTLMAVIGFIGGQVVFAGNQVSVKQATNMVEKMKSPAIAYVKETCEAKELQINSKRVEDVAQEDFDVLGLVKTPEGCYYWFYTAVLKGELGK